MEQKQTRGRSAEEIEHCVDMAMEVRDDLLKARPVTNERFLCGVQSSMILYGIMAAQDILKECMVLTAEQIQELVGSSVQAGINTIDALNLLELAEPVREIQRKGILAALAHWDRPNCVACLDRGWVQGEDSEVFCTCQVGRDRKAAAL